jgi:hypothetical protein
VDAPRKTPLQFSNRVIRQFVDNQFGNEAVMDPNDFSVIRVTFKHCQGLWEQVASGNIVHTNLLSQIVSSWGRQNKNLNVETSDV